MARRTLQTVDGQIGVYMCFINHSTGYAGKNSGYVGRTVYVRYIIALVTSLIESKLDGLGALCPVLAQDNEPFDRVRWWTPY